MCVCVCVWGGGGGVHPFVRVCPCVCVWVRPFVRVCPCVCVYEGVIMSPYLSAMPASLIADIQIGSPGRQAPSNDRARLFHNWRLGQQTKQYSSCLQTRQCTYMGTALSISLPDTQVYPHILSKGRVYVTNTYTYVHTYVRKLCTYKYIRTYVYAYNKTCATVGELYC